ncbi:MAG: hypothetical protein M1837_007280 [Sclerophora amabilis]|nr:MAG: hypothetical protein M1837_007280 [Sclerophora amabilis]
MSKPVSEFFTRICQNFNMTKKLKKDLTPGSRIVPARTAKNDANYQLRLDAGELIDGKRNVVLQVNTQARSTALKDWLKKNGSHAKLATATYDTTAADDDAETDRVMETLEKGAKEKF